MCPAPLVYSNNEETNTNIMHTREMLRTLLVNLAAYIIHTQKGEKEFNQGFQKREGKSQQVFIIISFFFLMHSRYNTILFWQFGLVWLGGKSFLFFFFQLSRNTPKGQGLRSHKPKFPFCVLLTVRYYAVCVYNKKRKWVSEI